MCVPVSRTRTANSQYAFAAVNQTGLHIRLVWTLFLKRHVAVKFSKLSATQV